MQSLNFSLLIGGILRSGIQTSIRFLVKDGVCIIVEIGIGEIAGLAMDEAGLYLINKGGKLYAGQTTREIATHLAEYEEGSIRRVFATFHVSGATLNEAAQWLIDLVKDVLDQDVNASLGKSNPGNKLGNLRNQLKKLVGKALPGCK